MFRTIGIKEKQFTAINSIFKKYSEIEEVILYGSRAIGNYKNGSDIDLTLKGKTITLSLLFKIETELDDLLLPHEIDLSIYHKIEKDDLLKHIKRVGRIFYENIGYHSKVIKFKKLPKSINSLQN